jgi:hypothetical protein
MRRILMVVAVVASVLIVPGNAQAGCNVPNRGGSAGPYDTAGVSYGDLEIAAWTYGNFATGPAYLCSDGTLGSDDPRGSFTVKRDGVVVCTSNDPAFRMTADPFGFGASIAGTGDGCAVAISFDGITAVPGVSADDIGADADGANAGARKNAPVKNFGEGGTDPSTVTLGDEVIEIPNGTLGFFSKGARAQSEQ